MTDSPQVVREGSMKLIAVVDVSPSMAAEDYRGVMPPKEIIKDCQTVLQTIPADKVVGPYGSRLDMAKYVIRKQIMPTLERNKIGIINYTGQGFVQAELTDDYCALYWMMTKRMGINQAPGGGSDYAEGLKTALDLFKSEPPSQHQKVILLFTDGGFTGDQANLTKVLNDIRQEGIKIIVVGVGASSPVPIPKYSSDGQVTGYVEQEGKVVQTAIDEAALQTLVGQTGGDYIRLDPASPPNVQNRVGLVLSATPRPRSTTTPSTSTRWQLPCSSWAYSWVSDCSAAARAKAERRCKANTEANTPPGNQTRLPL
ncbi:MAG: VWA domain-containing protein [Candidatus Competibacteraceae bacterium]|nr:VWA domain-containing protein [Candidatus Competibacteraceae bacterium]